MPLIDRTFSDIITFTRASTATYFDSAGVLQSAANDAPRFDYDPVTLAARGMLIEEQRTNLLRYSNDFTNPVWTSLVNGSGTTPTVTAAYTVSPDGTANATRLQASIGAGTAPTDYALIRQTITGLANPHDVSITLWMKSNTGITQNVYFRNSSGTGSSVTASVTPSWQRFTFTFLGIPFVSDDIQIGTRGGLSDATIDISIYGGQMEIAAFPTSYIPTTTAAATRAADVASVNTLSPWFNAAEGTLYSEATFTNTVSYNTAAALGDGTSSNAMRTIQWNDGTDRIFTVTNGGVVQASFTGTGQVGTAKFAGAYKLNDVNASKNGSIGTTDTTATIPTINTLWLGATGSANFVLNGYLRRIGYYKRRLSNAQLQAITQ